MTHLDDLLSGYVDGELSRDEERRVTRHLESCTPCRDELSEIHRARSAIRSLPVLKDPVQAGWTASRPRRAARWGASVLVVAAVLMAVVVMSRPPAPAPEQLDLQLMAERHVVRAVLDPGPPSDAVAAVGEPWPTSLPERLPLASTTTGPSDSVAP